MENKELCNKLIEDMFEEFDGIKEYKKLAELNKDNDEKYNLFKSMATDEMHHFNNIHSILTADMNDEQKKEQGCYGLLHQKYVEKYRQFKEYLQ